MFLSEIESAILLFNFIPESGALLLCGVSLIGGAFVARRLFKLQDAGKILRNGGENNESGESK